MDDNKYLAFRNELINKLKEKYKDEIEYRDFLNEQCKFVMTYFENLKDKLKDVCELSDGDVDIRIGGYGNHIVEFCLFNDTLQFDKTNTGIVVNKENNEYLKPSVDKIWEFQLRQTKGAITESDLDEILEIAFKDILNEI